MNLYAPKNDRLETDSDARNNKRDKESIIFRGFTKEYTINARTGK